MIIRHRQRCAHLVRGLSSLLLNCTRWMKLGLAADAPCGHCSPAAGHRTKAESSDMANGPRPSARVDVLSLTAGSLEAKVVRRNFVEVGTPLPRRWTEAGRVPQVQP